MIRPRIKNKTKSELRARSTVEIRVKNEIDDDGTRVWISKIRPLDTYVISVPGPDTAPGYITSFQSKVIRPFSLGA